MIRQFELDLFGYFYAPAIDAPKLICADFVHFLCQSKPAHITVLVSNEEIPGTRIDLDWAEWHAARSFLPGELEWLDSYRDHDASLYPGAEGILLDMGRPEKIWIQIVPK